MESDTTFACGADVIDPEFGTFGAEPVIRNGGLAMVGDYHIRPGVRVINHSHDTEVLILMLAGAMTDQGKNGDQGIEMLTPGSLRILPAGDRRDVWFGPDGARCLVIELQRPLERQDGARVTRRSVTRNPKITRLAARLKPESRLESPACALLADLDLTELLARFGREQKMTRVRKTPIWLDHVRATIDDMVAYPNVGDLAEVAGVHPLHLVRAFRAHFGHSIGDRVRLCRLKRAHQRVLETSEPLSTIAALTGFADQSHMTREFQRAFGVPPARMRRASPKR